MAYLKTVGLSNVKIIYQIAISAVVESPIKLGKQESYNHPQLVFILFQ